MGDAEARERRSTEKKITAIQEDWLQQRECLMRLTTMAHHLRESMLVNRPSSLGSSVLPPEPPKEVSWCRDSELPETAKALCDCIESLAVESRRFLPSLHYNASAEIHTGDHS